MSIFFHPSPSPPPASTSSFLSHTLLFWPNFFLSHTHTVSFSLLAFSSLFFTVLFLTHFVLLLLSFQSVFTLPIFLYLSLSTSFLSLCELVSEHASLFMSKCMFVAVVQTCQFVRPPLSIGAVLYCKHKKITGIIGKASTRLQPSDSNTV